MKSQNSGNQGFSSFFCLLMEGSGFGSGAVRIYYGSGFVGDPKTSGYGSRTHWIPICWLKSWIRTITVNSLTEQLWEKSTLSQRGAAPEAAVRREANWALKEIIIVIELMWARNSFPELKVGERSIDRKKQLSILHAWVAVGKTFLNF
jgi:hypothetical protein